MSYTLTIPDDVMQTAQHIADATAQTVEGVLLQRLNAPFPTLPPEEEAELAALDYLSDDALWTIARERLPKSILEHMETLMQANTDGSLSSEQHAKLENLVERGNRLTQRKAKAAALLTRHGHRVTLQRLTTTDD